MEIQANPDYESLKLILFISGSLILVLLAVVGFFLRQQVTVSQNLTNAVNELTVAINVIQSQEKDRHPVHERRLNEHSTRITNHENRIRVIEVEHKLFHPKCIRNEED